ncbi:triose-phosphate isomerase [candidate division KSB1 bacterium]|nr:triose-phosphate isomerase [candidate division KSB1 bacterium]
MRKLYIAGNWKMNTTTTEAEALVKELKVLVADMTEVDMAVAPPFVYLHKAVYLAKDSQIKVGAQNCYFESKGAFTGEIAPEMLKDVGCDFVILGHSERRHVLGETDEVINLKVKKALAAGLEVILCVGELLEEREAEQTEEVVKTQLLGGLKEISAENMAQITIAYEPVWAIGTGKTASPDQAQDVHAYIRKLLADNFSVDVANIVRIQYGGSVKPENAKELMGQPDIDGALVGGASLKADSFAAIAKAAV